MMVFEFMPCNRESSLKELKNIGERRMQKSRKQILKR